MPNKIIEYVKYSSAGNLQEYQDERNKAIKARDDKIVELEGSSLNALQADVSQQSKIKKDFDSGYCNGISMFES